MQRLFPKRDHFLPREWSVAIKKLIKSFKRKAIFGELAEVIAAKKSMQVTKLWKYLWIGDDQFIKADYLTILTKIGEIAE